MTKKCPKCGKMIPDESKFCLECGCHIYNKDNGSNISDRFSNGKIFLILIFVVLIIGGILIFTMGSGDNNSQNATDSAVSKEASEFDMTISDIDGFYSNGSGGKPYYYYWVDVLFQKVPSNQKEYLVRVTYLDENNTELGHEVESLSSVYYNDGYPSSVGHYTSYKYIDVDSAKVEIIKNGNVITQTTAKIDKNKLDFEKPKSK